ncbi:MAG: ABC transporter permease [Thermaerobacter sp.]|nr:ABC transporter permease [Thermaerobacter sp.]
MIRPEVNPQTETPSKIKAAPRVLREFFRSPGAIAGALFVLLTLFAAVLGPWLAPHVATSIDFAHIFTPPFFLHGGMLVHPLGTDYLGRDVLGMILAGARVSVDIALLAVISSLVIGTLIGLYSGYFGGRIGELLMRLTDLQMAFPFILMALTLMAISGPGLWKVVAVLALSGWTDYARIVRSQTLQHRQMLYVTAAKATGGSDARILFRHVLPNISASIIVIATMNIAVNILLEAGLSFLGLGISPSTPSWGAMVADGRNYVQTAWWLTVFPGLAIFLSVLGFNLLGDWLRDVMDPSRRH